MRGCSCWLLVLLALLIANKARGQVLEPGWLGVQVKDVAKEETDKLGWTAPRGAKLIRPDKGSPAEAAGLALGDVIFALDGVELANAQAFLASIKGKGVGTAVQLRLMRAGRELTVAVTLGARPGEYTLSEQAAQLYEARKYTEGLPVAKQAVALAEQRVGSDNVSVSQLLLGVGQFHDALSQYGEAEEAYMRALTIREKALGPDHPDLASPLNDVAFSHLRAQRYAEAEALYQRSLAIQDKASEPDNVLISNTLANFGQLYWVQDLHGKAEPLYLRSLATMEKARGPDHVDVRGPLERLAGLYEEQSRYDEAEPLRKRALAVTGMALGLDSPGLRPRLEKLATLYVFQDRHDDAEPLLKRVIEIMERELGPEHPDLVGARRKLALNYGFQRRYAEAEQVHKQSLAIVEKARGPDHPDVRRPLNILADFYESRHRLDDAEPLRKRGLAIVEKALGKDHPDFADQLYHLIGLYNQQNRHDEAEQLYLRMIAIAERLHGPDHPDLRKPLDSLAGLYETYMRRYDKAEPVRKRALAIVEKAVGPDHLDLKDPIRRLAGLYEEQRRYTEAEPLHKRWLAIMEKALGPDHLELASPLGPLEGLASNYESQKRYAEAEVLYQRALAIVENAREPGHPDVRRQLESLVGIYQRNNYGTGDAEQNLEKILQLRQRALANMETALGPDDPELGQELGGLADTYEGQKRYAEAEPLYWRWLAIVEKRRGPGHPDAQRPIEGLASLYERQERYTEAEPLRQRALANIKRARGDAHASVQSPLDSLATLYGKLRRYGEAEGLRKEWLAAVESAHGPDHPDVRRPLEDLASFYKFQHRYADAEPLLRRALSIMEKEEGPDSPEVRDSLESLASLYKELGRYAEAEPLYQRLLAAAEKMGGIGNSTLRLVLDNLVDVYRAQGRYADAEAIARRIVVVAEKELADEPHATGPYAVRRARAGLAKVLHEANRTAEADEIYRGVLAAAEDDGERVEALLDLGDFLSNSYRLTEAEQLYRRALALTDDGGSNKTHSSLDPGARAKNALAILLHKVNRLSEAEALFLQLRPTVETVDATDPVYAAIMGNFALLLEDMGRLAEAKALAQRALAMDEKLYGPDHPKVAVALNNLAFMAHRAKRYADAEPLARRSLAIREKVYGPEHPKVAIALNTLALMVERIKGYLEAEPLFRRAIDIEEKVYGPDHPNLATALNNLALLTYQTGRLDEAEALMRRALFIDKSTFGPGHPDVAKDLVHLAIMRGRHGDWAQAAALHAHAKPALIGAAGTSAANEAGLTKALLKQHSGWLRLHADALNRANTDSAVARAEGFELAQWALQTDAADAVTQMSVRFAKGDGPLAALVRERQSLVARRQNEDKRMLEAIGQADPKAVKGIYESRDDSKKTLKSIDAELAAKFPEYADLANPKPLSLAVTQALLRPDEALVLLLDGPQLSEQTRVPEATLAWVITKAKVSWHRISLDTRTLADHVTALRCGLDATQWDDAESREKCRVALQGSGYEGFDGSPSGVLPFDLARSHALYKALLGPAQSLVKGKHLLIVASGPLTSLPFGVLVAEPPQASSPATLDDYRRATWLGTRQPISVLPSVASLAALRRHARASQAAEPFVGFGDPALQGSARCGPPPAIPDRCPDEEIQVARRTHIMTRSGQGLAAANSYFRGGLANVDALRGACPLPDTAYELRCVSRSLGATPAAVLIGKNMTETAVKTAPLDRYRVVHFATHGLLAGETALFAKDRAEPALVMSPPDKATEADDGLLTASEVAGLKLDADWVVLSACNTAGGKEPGAEALSGLARAFFYAGARALLVSHWYVNSEAATLLISRTFAEMRSSARIGRAEAYRRAMLAVMSDDKRPWDAHPSAWAPFVVVGEGATTQPLAAAIPGKAAKGPRKPDEIGKRVVGAP